MSSDIHLSFFGRRIHVDCDSAEIADALSLIYARQRVAAPTGNDSLRVRVEAMAPGGPRIRVGRRTVRATSESRLLHHAHLVLVNAAAASAAGVQVLHAGAVERDGRAVVLIAPSGGGKTTTTLAMVRRGWRLLSDDFAVLGDDGRVQPFVRRLNLTDATLELLGLRPPAGAVRVAAGRGAKWMADIEDLVPGATGEPAELGTVFVMGRHPTPKPTTASDAGLSRTSAIPASGTGEATDEAAGTAADALGDSRYGPWRIEIDHLPDGLLDRLGDLEGVTGARAVVDPNATFIELRVEDGARIVQALDAALASLDVAVLGVRRPVAEEKAIAVRPCVERLSQREALLEILPHDLGLSGRRFLYGTSDADLALAVHSLGRNLARADGRIYRLWQGGLAPTVDLIEALAAADHA